MIEGIKDSSHIIPWLLAARPKTLSAAITPIFVASVLALHYGQAEQHYFVYYFSILALFSTIFIQIGTNLINDALDFKKGADNERRLGPKRVTQSGLLTEKQVIFGGLVSFFIAALFAIPLVIHAGLPIFIIGCVSLLFGYLYTGGPYPLAYKGLGEIFVIFFFGLVAVCGVFYLQTGFLNKSVLIAGVEVGTLATVLISINNYRDYIEDKKVGKMTLAARFGAKFAKLEIMFLFILTYFVNFYWFFEINIWCAVLPLLTIPLAFKITRGVFIHTPSKVFNKYLGMSALVQILFGLLLGIGILIG